MRLVKFLANAGVASRRASDEIIRAGRVTIEGKIVTDPARDVTEADRVDVDGTPVVLVAEPVVYLVNKPRGVVSTAADPQRRRTVISLIDSHLRLYPVGRLDIDTTGLILLTNDGALAHRLTHPSFEVPRTYHATLSAPPITDKEIRELRTGVMLEDGRTAPARVKRLGERAENRIELEIREGRNRQIKRMCEAVGHRVTALERVAFGPLQLGRLGNGAHRKLSPAEIAALQPRGSSEGGSAGRSRRARRSA